VQCIAPALENLAPALENLKHHLLEGPAKEGKPLVVSPPPPPPPSLHPH
jgi:hypothetical protein